MIQYLKMNEKSISENVIGYIPNMTNEQMKNEALFLNAMTQNEQFNEFLVNYGSE